MYTPEEQKEHRRMWVKALRSGEYAQGKDVLCRKTVDTFEYCCLGIACKISGLGEFVPMYNLSHSLSAFTFVTREEQPQDAVLPKVVQDWLGLRYHSGWYSNGGMRSLTKLNDNGASFTTIADVIESEPDELISSNKE